MITVSKTLLPLALVAALLAGCATQQSSPHLEKTNLVGIWAMFPLANGIANVAEYQADGKVQLHSFNCVEQGDAAVEVSDYSLAADGKAIHIKSPEWAFDLRVVAFAGKLMVLGMPVSGSELKFLYKKVDQVQPLCDAFPNAKTEAARRTAYQPADFIPAPAIPPHAGMERYVGTWLNKKKNEELQILLDTKGTPYLSLPSSENWSYLFNDVRWEGDVLHYQSFAYSKKPDLFRHPYHKTNTPITVEPTADGKLLSAYVIGAKRFESVLERKAD
ncbi:hypothetical protein EI693_10235 [Pseudomonas oryziphila]|uniref:Lipoprotein n=1 Tax=Pseudomonas oryziphila TaxID=2894079 RepID=A0ABM7CPV6_9PSED|nr:hypothetical protein EI693_10235 [Pseudomonas oryziphila]